VQASKHATRAQPRFRIVEPKVGVDVRDTEAVLVVWDSAENGASMSKDVFDMTMSQSVILMIIRDRVVEEIDHVDSLGETDAEPFGSYLAQS
jgi:hypothetical protein